MGMFDWVDFKVSCPACGAEVVGFQTQDRDCFLETIPPDGLNCFYSHCPDCSEWIEFTWKYPVEGRAVCTSHQRPEDE